MPTDEIVLQIYNGGSYCRDNGLDCRRCAESRAKGG